MNKLFAVSIFVFFAFASLEAKSTPTQNSAEALKAKHVKEQMEREKKFAKEQKFYQGDEYDFSAEKVDPKDVDSVPEIEPENDFDMTDVYRDDI
jgi:hypothetical protein